jgi:uncharacterized protein GlcG (DUF336 family)
MFETSPCLTLKGAKALMAAAEAEAIRNQWNVAVAIVDAGAHLVLFQKMDGTQLGSVDVALGKARTALRFRRPTRVLEEMIAAGKQGFLAVEGILPVQGGLPIASDGVVVGAIGVSGLTSVEDEQVATAALAALG